MSNSINDAANDAAKDAAQLGGSDEAARGVTEVGFDQTLIALRQVVERLESGSLSLEASLQAFEEGIRLARHGTHILDAAEHRVEVLTSSAGASPSATKIEPFTPSSP